MPSRGGLLVRVPPFSWPCGGRLQLPECSASSLECYCLFPCAGRSRSGPECQVRCFLCPSPGQGRGGDLTLGAEPGTERRRRCPFCPPHLALLSVFSTRGHLNSCSRPTAPGRVVALPRRRPPPPRGLGPPSPLLQTLPRSDAHWGPAEDWGASSVKGVVGHFFRDVPTQSSMSLWKCMLASFSLDLLGAWSRLPPASIALNRTAVHTGPCLWWRGSLWVEGTLNLRKGFLELPR